MASTETNGPCAEVLEHLAEVLDGTASPRLLEHVVECDTCRDARYDAEAARRASVDAGLDHRASADWETRVLAALDARDETEPRPVAKPAVQREETKLEPATQPAGTGAAAKPRA